MFVRLAYDGRINSKMHAALVEKPLVRTTTQPYDVAVETWCGRKFDGFVWDRDNLHPGPDCQHCERILARVEAQQSTAVPTASLTREQRTALANLLQASDRRRSTMPTSTAQAIEYMNLTHSELQAFARLFRSED